MFERAVWRSGEENTGCQTVFESGLLPHAQRSERSDKGSALVAELTRRDGAHGLSAPATAPVQQLRSELQEALSMLSAATQHRAQPVGSGGVRAVSLCALNKATFMRAASGPGLPLVLLDASGMRRRHSVAACEGLRLDALGFTSGRHVRAVEFGCGYGTFTVPVAQRVQKLHTFDIEEHMVETSRQRLAAAGLEARVELEVRDVLAQGYGLEAEADAVLLMNILHCQEPVQMLRQAAELLEDQGLVYAIHWRYDESTPRGPPMKIRPRPEQLADWAMQTGLLEVERGPIDCPPWHYGWTFRRA
ncbi:unnamed protein product [Effrenium voratum]|nr:unnamed protein product [Effrenium voratum]